MAEAISENGYFQTKLAEFQAKFDEFEGVLSAVTSAQVTDPELKAEQTELIGRADMIQNVIRKTKDSINWAEMQLKQLGDTLGDLGVFPVVAIAVAAAAIVGAIAYMSSWISDAYAWAKKAEIADTVARAGGSPEAIQQAIAERTGGIFGNIGVIGILALGLGAIWWMQNRG